MDVLDLGGGAGESSEESKGPGKNKKNAPKKAPAKASPPGVAFAQRIGVIFSTMYNMFVDAEMLEMIYDVAGRLAASATSPEKWASTELGRLVRFADDRSRNRVRKVCFRFGSRDLINSVSINSYLPQHALCFVFCTTLPNVHARFCPSTPTGACRRRRCFTGSGRKGPSS